MKNIYSIVLAFFCMAGLLHAQGVRYQDEVFTDVVKIEDQIYSVNVTVVTGVPGVDTLLFDLYMPAGDTCSERPLAIVLHTGTFLPRGLFAPTGDKDDYANVQISERLAKQGYVAASIQYRAGWNPISPQDTVRRSTIINAAYRGIQDLYAFIRFSNMTVENLGNPFKIDPDRIAIFGIGTGAFVGFNAAVLTQDEIYIEKFTNPGGTPMIDTFLVGNLTGETPGLINVPNHVGFSNDFHFAFGLDGAVGDSSWMEDGTSVPLVAAGTVTHPTTPFGLDPISGDINCELPVYAGAGTGSFVVNIGGSVCMIAKANALGINNPLNVVAYNDPVSEAIRNDENVFGQEHLWAINLPGPQTGPWEYWDSTFWDMVPHPISIGSSIHEVGLATNPDMSIEKADRYIDTALWFFSPRAFTALKLNELVCTCENVIPDPSEVVMDDFECQRNFSFSTGIDRLMVMNNPLSGASNNSEKVGAYLEAANDPWAALCLHSGDSIDLTTHNIFKMDMVSPGADIPVLLKLEGGSSPAFEVWTNTTSSGEWETLTADFSSQAGAHHTRLCIFPNAGENTPDEVNYFLDNLRLEFSTGIFNPVVERLEIAPNPVSNVLYVRNPGEATIFRVINTLGQQVMDMKVQNQHVVSIHMGHLQDGIYLVGAYNAQGKLIANARILKN